MASLSQGRTAAAQCDLFTHKSVPVIFEPSSIITEGNENRLTKWQEQWTSFTKGVASKLFFLYKNERMKTSVSVSSEFTAVATGHGLTRSCLRRFKFIPNSTCPCRIKEEQTVDHIILNCTQLENERRFLRNVIVRTGDTWPPPFEQLTRKHIKTFTNFVRSTDFSAF